MRVGGNDDSPFCGKDLMGLVGMSTVVAWILSPKVKTLDPIGFSQWQRVE
jgi:hypothetical protein